MWETAVALVGGLWLALAGFFVVKNAVARDETSGVGQVLAATVLRRPVYLLGKDEDAETLFPCGASTCRMPCDTGR